MCGVRFVWCWVEAYLVFGRELLGIVLTIIGLRLKIVIFRVMVAVVGGKRWE